MPRDYYRNRRSEMAAFLPADYHRVLEVGCGEGAFSANLDPGCEIWGVEQDATAARAASERMKVVLVGAYQEVAKDLPDESFDLAVCNDIIEHMPEPEAFLSSIRTKLEDGGYLVASIPNVRYWENLRELLIEKDWRYREAGVLDRTHLRFFTEKSIRRLFEDQNFVIEKLEGINRRASFKHILVLGLLGALTLGSWRDIQHLQYAIRARKGGRG